MCSNNKAYFPKVWRKLNKKPFAIIPCADGGVIIEMNGFDYFIEKQGFETIKRIVT